MGMSSDLLACASAGVQQGKWLAAKGGVECTTRNEINLPLAGSCYAVKQFIAPSLPFQGDQAVDAHAAWAPPPPYSLGRVWSIVPCGSRGDDRALIGPLGG